MNVNNVGHTHTTKLTARPVFAMLNEKIMAFFDNDEDSDSVIKTISLS